MLKIYITLKRNLIKRTLTKFCLTFLGGLNENELTAFDKSLMPYFQPSAVRHIPPEIFQVRAWLLKKLLNFYSSRNKLQHWFIGFGFGQKIFYGLLSERPSRIWNINFQLYHLYLWCPWNVLDKLYSSFRMHPKEKASITKQGMDSVSSNILFRSEFSSLFINICKDAVIATDFSADCVRAVLLT